MQQQHYFCKKWINVLFTMILPGSAHFLAGQRMWGMLWYLGFLCLICLLWFSASIPGAFFAFLTLFIFFVLLLYMMVLMFFSWHLVPRLGYMGLLLYFIFALCFNYFVFRPFIAQPCSYSMALLTSSPDGQSMSPTIHSTASSPLGIPDVVATNWWMYRYEAPKRGDIVGFFWYDRNGNVLPTTMVKRVVGLPGETIDIDPPYVLVNGNPLIEPDIFKKISSCQDGYTGYGHTEFLYKCPLPLTLGDDEYFLLGDNFEQSIDSRMLGPIPRRNIKYREIRIVFPFSRIKEL